MIYKGFLLRRATTFNAKASDTPGQFIADYSVNDSFAGGILGMGMQLELNSTVNFYDVASNAADNIFTSAKSLHGLVGDDLIYGTQLAQQLYGDDGNDTINGGGGADSLDGGLGINMASFGIVGTGVSNGTINPYGIGVSVDLIKGTFVFPTTKNAAGVCIYTGAAGTVKNFRQVWGGTGNDTVIAENTGDTIWGNEGRDIITGGSGADLIFGDGNGAASTDGADTISSGAGNDTIFGGLGGDRMTTGNGNDAIYGDYAAFSAGQTPDVNDTISAGNGRDTIFGGLGKDVISTGSGNSLIYGDYAGLASADGQDLINVGSGANTIYGGGGDDTIVAAGAPSLGNLIFGDQGYGLRPTTQSSPSVDFLASSTAVGSLVLRLRGSSPGLRGSSPALLPALTSDDLGFRAVFGDSYSNDAIIGGKDSIIGAGGNDSVFGGAGNDLIDGFGGNDILVGGSGSDTIYTGGAGGYSILTPVSGGYAIGDVVVVGKGVGGATLANPNAEYATGETNAIYVGYDVSGGSPVVAPGLGAAMLADFDPAFSSLTVAQGATAVVGGIVSLTDWSGADTLDMSGAGVVNGGLTVLMTGAGNDSITVGSGNYYIYAQAGLNEIQLGANTDARIYLDTFDSRANVKGFDSTDTLYINKQIVDALVNGATPSASIYQARTNLTGGPSGWSTASSSASAGVWGGQDYNGGIMGALAYGMTYREYIGKAPSGPEAGYNSRYPQIGPVFGLSTPVPADYTVWGSNGAYTNATHDYAGLAAKVADYASGVLAIYLGNILTNIPFVGPIIAIPLWTIGGLTINDAVNNVQPHKNATYSTADNLAGNYVNYMKPVVTTIDQTNWQKWVNVPFNNFFYTGSIKTSNLGPLNGYSTSGGDGYAPALEVTAADIPGNTPTFRGIHSIVAVSEQAGSNWETYVYLVNSPDNMIQNNEATLIATVDYKLTAKQIVMYDASVDNYNPIGSLTPVIPPTISSVTLSFSNSYVGNALPSGGYVTTATTPGVTINFNGTLANAQTVSLLNGSDVVNTWTIGNANNDYTFTAGQNSVSLSAISNFTSLGSAYSVIATSAQGFQSQLLTTLVYDSHAINDATVTALGENIKVTSLTAGYVSGGNTIAGDIGLFNVSSGSWVTQGNSPFTVTDTTDGLFAATLSPYIADVYTPASGASTIDAHLMAQDSLGLRYDTGEMVRLGTGGNNTLTASSVDFAVYGLDGNDSIVGSTHSEILSGGAGRDTIIGGNGTVSIFGGDGDDSIVGGTGADLIVGGVGADAITLATGARANDTIAAAPGESLVSGYDVVAHFLLPALGQAGDVLNLDSSDGLKTPTIASSGDLTTAVTTGGVTISSATVAAGGLVTFSGLSGTFATNLAAIGAFLHSNLVAQKTVMFADGSDSYVFEGGGASGSDTLIKLTGIAAAGLQLSGGSQTNGFVQLI